MNSDILTNTKINNDQDILSIRPNYLNEFIGQTNVKDNLIIFIQAAKNRNQPLDHVILYGPPGLGKTTLAQIIAKELGTNIKSISGPSISKAADLAAILTNLNLHDVLFIDEIHRLNTNIEEILYSAMEDYFIDIIIGEGTAARSVKINIPKFTLIGATTRLGLLSNPLRDRFGIPIRLNFYNTDELTNIILRVSKLLNTNIEEEGAIEIAQRSRGTPRIAIRLLKRICDFALVHKKLLIDIELVKISLNSLEVDTKGLDNNDYRYLCFIADNYACGPVGIDTLSAGLLEQKDSIEEIIEPYLMQIGFLHRTRKGRIITNLALKHLGILPK